MLEVHNLHKRFGPNRALSGVDLAVSPGEILGFVGRNGAGKTTTLKIIATLLSADEGDVVIDGHTRPDERRRRLGLFNNEMRLPTRLTAREALEYQGHLHGMRPVRLNARINELADALSLDYLHLLCENLSTGMAQRVMIARTLIHEPQVVMLDEASSGLDVIARRELQELVQQFANQGCAVVYSTHVLGELADFATKTALIHQGKILNYQQGFDLERTVNLLAHVATGSLPSAGGVMVTAAISD